MADKIVKDIIKDLSKKLGTGTRVGVMGDDSFDAEPEIFIPCSSTLLNYSIGGGAAVGRSLEIDGHEQTGKSLLLLDFLAHAQKMNAYTYYQDAEYANRKDFAMRLCGVDISSIGHIEVATQEQSWQATFQIMESVRKHDEDMDRIIAIGLDSLAALPAKASKELNFEEAAQIAHEARIIRAGFRRLTSDIARSKTAFIYTNHLIHKIGGMAFGEKYESWGGTGPKYFVSTKIKLDTIGKETNDGVIEAIKCRATVIKNRFNPPGHKIDYNINVRGPYLGIDDHTSIINFLDSKNALGSKTGYVSWDGVQMRKKDLVKLSREKPELYKALQDKAKEVFSKGILDFEDTGIVDGE